MNAVGIWLGLALLFAALVGGPAWSPPISIGLIVASGALLFLHWSRRTTADRRLVYVVCGTYAIRSIAALFLFVASSHELPVLRSLQAGGGFWHLAPDAVGYHGDALEMLRNGVCSGWITAGSALNLFAAWVAMLYWLFVPHPLVPIVFNVWAATATALLAFGLARRLSGSDATGVAAAALVGFWPSTLMWSTQLLREPGLLFLVFLVFALVGRLCGRVPGGTERAPGRVLRAAILLAGIGGAVLLLAKSRPYAGWIMVGAFALVALASFAWRRGHAALVWGGVALVLGVWVGIAQILWLPVTALPFRPVGVASGFKCPVVVAVAAAPSTPSPDRAPGSPPPGSPPVKAPRPSGTSLVKKMPSPLPKVSLDTVAAARQGFAKSGGTLRADAGVNISTPLRLLRQLPEAVAAALLAPYPWRWFAGATTGAFRSLAGMEVVLIVALLPALVLGAARAIRTRSFLATFMLVDGIVIWLMAALVVVNEGTLFRLRLQGMLPVLVVGIAGGGLGVYRDLARRISSLLRRAPAPAESARPDADRR